MTFLATLLMIVLKRSAAAKLSRGPALSHAFWTSEQKRGESNNHCGTFGVLRPVTAVELKARATG